MKKLVVAFFAVLFALSAPEFTLCANQDSINGRQGDVLLYKFSEGMPPNATAVMLNGNGRKLRDVIVFEKNNVSYALIPISLKDQPGKYFVLFRGVRIGEREDRLKIPLYVRKGIFPIHLSSGWKSQVETTEEFVERTRERDAIMKAQEESAAKPQWLNGFSSPLGDYTGALKITHPFGEERINPRTQYIRFHEGADIASPEGFPVRAIADGRVILVGYNYLLEGNVTIIDHGARVFSVYLHQSQIIVKHDDFVKKGQEIGKVGHTGKGVSGPHLHLIVRICGTEVNPLQVLKLKF